MTYAFVVEMDIHVYLLLRRSEFNRLAMGVHSDFGFSSSVTCSTRLFLRNFVNLRPNFGYVLSSFPMLCRQCKCMRVEKLELKGSAGK